MSAANAKRALADTTVDHVNSTTGSVYAFKRVGISYTGYMRLTREMQKDRTRPANVPCRSCSTCCYHPRIEVVRANEPAERLTNLDLAEDPLGDMQMRGRPDGACVHQGDRGCSVYEHHPTTCRTYVCRAAGMFGMAVDHGNGYVEPAWEFVVTNQDDKVVKTSIRFLKDPYRIETGDVSGDRIAESQYIAAKLPATMGTMRRALRESSHAAA